jgi:hypothetical protein
MTTPDGPPQSDYGRNPSLGGSRHLKCWKFRKPQRAMPHGLRIAEDPPAEEDAARNAQPSVALETAPAATGADHRRARRASNEYVRLESDPIG